MRHLAWIFFGVLFLSQAALAQMRCAEVVSNADLKDPKPENQPVMRSKKLRDVPSLAADPIPLWRSGEFKKLGVIMEPDPNVWWKAKDVFNPSAIVGDDGRIYLIYRAENKAVQGQWQSRIGI